MDSALAGAVAETHDASAAKERGRAFIAVAVPLCVGAAFYLLRRGCVPDAVAAIHLDLTLRQVQERLAPLANVVPACILDSGPDAAWAAAVGGFVTRMWRDRGGAQGARIRWMFAGATIAVGYEIGQGLKLVPGTFDVADVVASVLGFALAVVFNNKEKA